MGKYNDLSGQTFGKLKVIERCEDYIQPSGQHIVMFLCQCQCENKPLIKVRAAALRNGTTKSCGCLRKEILAKRFAPNTYKFFDDYGVGYTSNGKPFYFDREDYDKIKDDRWYINKGGYVVSKNKRMNRVVMDCPDDMIVDHIHGKDTRNDNRKCNLRIATLSENAHNVEKKKNNTSGVVGVSYSKNGNKWLARIMVEGKAISLGCFDNFDDAVNARKEAERKYYKSFSYNESQSEFMSDVIDLNGLEPTTWQLFVENGEIYVEDSNGTKNKLIDLMKQYQNLKIIQSSSFYD